MKHHQVVASTTREIYRDHQPPRVMVCFWTLFGCDHHRTEPHWNFCGLATTDFKLKITLYLNFIILRINTPIPHYFYHNFKCHISQYLHNSNKIFIISHFPNGLIEKEEVNSMNLSFLKRATLFIKNKRKCESSTISKTEKHQRFHLWLTA